MTQAAHTFADRVTHIAVTGNLIRIELGTLQAPAAQGQQAQLTASQTLVMPLEGFLPSFGMMETVVKKLVADGVIKLQPATDGAPASAA